MGISLYRLTSFPSLMRQYHYNRRKQEEFIEKSIAVDIRNIQKNNDGTLTEKDIRKIYTYYGLAVPAVLGEGYCMLRGENMSLAERNQLTYMGALTGLFDDFFDEHDTDPRHIRELINSPRPGIAANSHEELFIRFYLKALDRENEPMVKEQLNKVCDAQVLSKRQEEQGITKEEISKITLEKGGASILFYRCAFPEQITENEQSMLYHLGGLGQLENDIFDIYKDHADHIQTLATTASHVEDLRREYAELSNDVFTLLNKTHHPSPGRKQFSRFIKLIYSRGLVCLDHLQKLEVLSGGIFDITSYTRDDLLCDMEKKSGRLKLVRHYLKK